MKNRFASYGAAMCCLALAMACGNHETNHDHDGDHDAMHGEASATHETDPVTRGEYLVLTNGCPDCHAPKTMTDRGPVPDMDRFLSGHPAEAVLPPPAPDAVKSGWVLFTPDLTASVGPWGTSFSANLTPDTATGIGAWTEEIWLRAFKGGKFHGLPAGRDLLPPMPVPAFKNMTDADALAIFAYLKTIKPVSNAVPPPVEPAAM